MSESNIGNGCDNLVYSMPCIEPKNCPSYLTETYLGLKGSVCFISMHRLERRITNCAIFSIYTKPTT